MTIKEGVILCKLTLDLVRFEDFSISQELNWLAPVRV